MTVTAGSLESIKQHSILHSPSGHIDL